jgi:hypothetical protein
MEIRLEIDEELMRRVERVTGESGCSVADVAAAALDLFVCLPMATLDSLHYVKSTGSYADLAALMSGIARVVADVEYELSYRQVVASISPGAVEGLESEDDIIAEAVRITSRSGSPDASRAGEARGNAVPIRKSFRTIPI